MPAKKRTAPEKKKPIHSEPGFVAHCVPYVRFVFPGEVTPPPAPMQLAELAGEIRDDAETIERPEVDGLSEAWAGFLADKLLDWLAGRAGEGSAHAQASLVEISRKAVGWHSWSMLQGHETTIARAQKCPEVPGWISLNPEHTAFWQTKLEEIGQGKETPGTMKPVRGKKGKRLKISEANFQLVTRLCDYMNAYRRHTYIKIFQIPRDHHEIPERIREILKLPDFCDKPKVVKAWHKVGYEIVKDWTNRDPASHPAFNRPPLAKMNLSDLYLKEKSPISTRLLASWKALAREESRIKSGI